MFDLLEKMFEVVAAPVSQEEMLRTYWEKKNKVNTKLTKSTWTTEPWLKFWLLTNGDIIPVIHSHDKTTEGSGASYYKLMGEGAFAGSILDGELSLSGHSMSGEFTPDQISKLKSYYIEYNITRVVVSAKNIFGVDVKSSKELAYYLEYGKEEWESKIKGDLLEKILEVSAYRVVGYEDGWIAPSGEFVEITEETHIKDAYRILRSKGHSEEFLKKKKSSLLDFFYSETKYIRCVIGTKENEIDIFVPDIKVTRRQLSTIRKFAEIYEDFYYTIKADAHGWDFSEFMKDVRKYLEMEG